jgi:hypothetical protein
VVGPFAVVAEHAPLAVAARPAVDPFAVDVPLAVARLVVGLFAVDVEHDLLAGARLVADLHVVDVGHDPLAVDPHHDGLPESDHPVSDALHHDDLHAVASVREPQQGLHLAHGGVLAGYHHDRSRL